MRGLDRLIDIRRQGLRPDGIVTFWAFGSGQRYPFEGTVLCEQHDQPELADLRPFVGLTVHVIAGGFSRFDEGEAWARALMKARADSVLLSVAVPPDEGYIAGPACLRWKGDDIA